MDIATLLPNIGGTAFTLVAFVVALSVIVAVHEYGHYIVGRWSGIHAEVFSLGFGPVLFSRRDRRGTLWQVAALPFGGYVKFLGDSDAASGKDAGAIAELSAQEKRRTMHGAPLWARAATVAAGPVFNFIMSIAIFAGIVLVGGQMRDPLTVGDIRAVPAEVNELRPGDEILAIGGVSVDEGLGVIRDDIPKEAVVEYRIRRDGTEATVTAPYPFPAVVSQLTPQSAAYDAGLRPGDVLIEVDDQPIFAFDALKDVVESSDGRPIPLTVWSMGETRSVTLLPRRVDEPGPDGGFVTNWRIGIAGGMLFEPATERAGVVDALGYGVTQTGFIIQSSLSGLWHMITGAISTCNMSGPIGIAEASGAMASQGVSSFIWFIAVLSTAVGLLNLFPIPVLDGGHLVFHAWEALTGSPPSDRALRILMTGGLAIILSLMVFALSNDLFCP
ncbi:regulator of sigma E protease [Poseidonocella pacifica]|uniref:Zinc metalloprotease n=1 Tax=Poseidonocella pacifica TaxID=871651 RepID=A0A1I0VI22_9RHOB|nr:RIP metalloprotease RseP [Poseidonocella pacifica]SFA76024.1 regulator of sigma E protease [Poseidonocella pacifica]